MEKLLKIRTPWKQQFRRVRYQLLPVLSMGGALLLTMWLWNRHVGIVNGVGEVVANEANIIASRDGVLMDLPGRQKLTALMPVEEGQLLAALDSRPLLASLAELKRDVSHLRAQLPAIANGATTRPADSSPITLLIEHQRLSVIEQRAQDRIEQPVRPKFKNRERISDALTAAENTLAQLQRSVTTTRPAPEVPAGKRLLTTEEFLAIAAKEVEKELLARRPDIDALEARMGELELEAQCLEIRAPFSGEILQVHRHPGQAVSAGGLIATIGEREAFTVLSYIRQEQGIQPHVGEWVEVRTRLPGRKPIQGYIAKLGSRAQPIPVHQLRDAKVPEFGTPVFITVKEMPLRPGYLVDVRFTARPEPQ